MTVENIANVKSNSVIKAQEAKFKGNKVYYGKNIKLEAQHLTIEATDHYAQRVGAEIQCYTCDIKTRTSKIESSIKANFLLLSSTENLYIEEKSNISTENTSTIHAGKLSYKGKLTSSGETSILFDIKNQVVFHDGALMENRHSNIIVKADSCFLKSKVKVVEGTLNFSINKHLVIGLTNDEMPSASDLFPLTKLVTIEAKELNVVAGAYINLANMRIGRTLKTSSLLRIEFLAIKTMFSSIQNSLFAFDFLNVNIPNPASVIELITKVIKLDFSYIKKEFLTLSVILSTVSSLVNQLKIIAPAAGQVAGIIWSLTQLSMTLPSMVKQTKQLIKNTERGLRDVIPIIVGLKSGLTIGANLADQSSILYDSVEQENFDLLALNEIDPKMLISSLKTAVIAIGNLNSSDALIESSLLNFNLSTSNISRNLIDLDAGNISVALFLQNISQLSLQEHSLTIAETAVLEGHQANLDHTDIVSNKLIVALSGDLNQSSGVVNSHDANIHAETLNQGGDILLDKANVAVTEHQIGQQGKYVQEGGSYQSEKTDIDPTATFIQANTISNIELLENKGNYQTTECATKGKQYHNQGKAKIIGSKMDFENYQSTKESKNILDGTQVIGTQAQMAGLNQLNETKFVEKEKIDVDKETALKVTKASLEAAIINFNADDTEVDTSLLLKGENELNISENSHVKGDGILGMQSEKANIAAQIISLSLLTPWIT